MVGLLLLVACGPSAAPTSTGDPGTPGSPPAVGGALELALLDDDEPRTYVARTVRTDVAASASVGGGDLEGQVDYRTVVDGAVVCDAAIALRGAVWSESCDGCSYAFAVEGSVTTDAGTEDCQLYGPLSYTSDTIWREHRLAFWDSDAEAGPDGRVIEMPDVSRVGYLIDYAAYGGGQYGPYWWTLATPYTDTRGFARDGDRLAWWLDELAESVVPTWYRECDGLSGTVLPPPAVSGPAAGQVDCSGEVADRWTFEADAGTTLLIAADTVGADTAADLALFVNGPDGCTLTFADDSFPCTHPPVDHSCPAVQIPSAGAGIYQVAVWSYGDCVGDVAGYRLAAWTVQP
ncbi:MAG: hypothetical protein VX265_03890 [Myxococcota bacterium]|nr:hypothetical protein [Myxococcota bacterium]MEC8424360.1 hypothetical protein [Myxococcota bacterium]